MACDTMQVKSNWASPPEKGGEEVGKVTESFVHQGTFFFRSEFLEIFFFTLYFVLGYDWFTM